MCKPPDTNHREMAFSAQVPAGTADQSRKPEKEARLSRRAGPAVGRNGGHERARDIFRIPYFFRIFSKTCSFAIGFTQKNQS